MIRLSTIGTPTVFIDEKPVSTTNDQIVAATLFLVVEAGKPIPRKFFAEMFFPDGPEAGTHAGRQLVYRLRKIGVPLTGDPTTLTLAGDAATWDVRTLIERGAATDSEVVALQGGYLAEYRHHQPERFAAWVDEHRSQMTGELRMVLLRQMQAMRAKKDYRALHPLARACLALDPLNEEATLAAAESLAAVGAKADALNLLDQYLEDVGPRVTLHIAPKLLRERISTYFGGPDSRSIALVGRRDELATLTSLIDQSAARCTRACFITGAAGIGKTRLIEEACAAAALNGHAVVRARLTRQDSERPFAILRDIGPALLDLPGAIGASPEALAAVRGLCGRGPTQYSRRPENASEAKAITADVRRKVVDLVDAVAEEQPLIIWIEDADQIDEASTELIGDLINDGRRLCLIAASRRTLAAPDQLVSTAALSRVTLGPLSPDETSEVLSELFREANREKDRTFTENAVRVSAGSPLFAHLLFKNYLVTGDPMGLPDTLAGSLAARLDQLHEPVKSVFDAVVVLGRHSREATLEAVTELPRYRLVEALRLLDEQGFARVGDGVILPAHDLLSAAAQRRMPASVARLLHRAAAKVLEGGEAAVDDPLAIAMHWEKGGQSKNAISVLLRSARAYTAIGRPHEAIALIRHAKQISASNDNLHQIDALMLDASHAAGEDHLSVTAAEGLGLYSGSGSVQRRLVAFESLVGAGRPLLPHQGELEAIASNRAFGTEFRGRAARLLMMIAEDVARPDVAHAALKRIEDLCSDSVETLTPRLIHEAVFGSLDTATSLANQLHDLSVADSRIGVQLQGRFSACFALWRCGESAKAIALAEQAFRVAQDRQIWSACTGFASMVANISWSSDLPDAAKAWLKTASESLARSGGPDRGFQAMGLEMSIALDEDDPIAAQAILDEADRLFPGLRSNRLGVDLLANEIAIRLARGERPSETQTEQLLEGHIIRRQLGLQDFLADTVVGALGRLGRLAEAQQLRDDYLTKFRRDRFGIAKSLKYLSRRNVVPKGPKF